MEEKKRAALIIARLERELTIEEAAKAIGISTGMLSMLESGQRNGTDQTKYKVSSFYKKSIAELFYANHFIT